MIFSKSVIPLISFGIIVLITKFITVEANANQELSTRNYIRDISSSASTARLNLIIRNALLEKRQYEITLDPNASSTKSVHNEKKDTKENDEETKDPNKEKETKKDENEDKNASKTADNKDSKSSGSSSTTSASSKTSASSSSTVFSSSATSASPFSIVRPTESAIPTNSFDDLVTSLSTNNNNAASASSTNSDDENNSNKSNSKTTIIVAAVCGSVGAILIIIIAVIIVRKRNQKKLEREKENNYNSPFNQGLGYNDFSINPKFGKFQLGDINNSMRFEGDETTKKHGFESNGDIYGKQLYMSGFDQSIDNYRPFSVFPDASALPMNNADNSALYFENAMPVTMGTNVNTVIPVNNGSNHQSFTAHIINQRSDSYHEMHRN